jgi:DNA-binding NarL/FixJ family response regulator
VLLLDVMMPGTNGADVLRVLATQSTRSCGCVIAYPASPVRLGLASELGADAAVLKSGDLEPVLAAMSNCPTADRRQSQPAAVRRAERLGAKVGPARL